MIYVLVEILYDYHRFQNNLFASSNLKDVNKFIASIRDTHSIVNWPVKRYAYDDEITRSNLWDREVKHLWIQEFPNE